MIINSPKYNGRFVTAVRVTPDEEIKNPSRRGLGTVWEITSDWIIAEHKDSHMCILEWKLQRMDNYKPTAEELKEIKEQGLPA